MNIIWMKMAYSSIFYCIVYVSLVDFILFMPTVAFAATKKHDCNWSKRYRLSNSHRVQFNEVLHTKIHSSFIFCFVKPFYIFLWRYKIKLSTLLYNKYLLFVVHKIASGCYLNKEQWEINAKKESHIFFINSRNMP